MRVGKGWVVFRMRCVEIWVVDGLGCLDGRLLMMV